MTFDEIVAAEKQRETLYPQRYSTHQRGPVTVADVLDIAVFAGLPMTPERAAGVAGRVNARPVE